MKRRTCLMFGPMALTMLGGAGPAAEIGFPRARIFPESISITRAGALFTGGADEGAVWRARPGAKIATEWLSPAQSGIASMFGVFADDRSDTVWICGRPKAADPDAVRLRSAALFAFDLKTKAPKGRWPMPDGVKDVCNDIAIAADGTLYIAETGAGRILRLKTGAAALDVWFTDPALMGLDGIAFDADGKLYLSSVRSNRVFRMMPGADGAPGPLTELAPSRPLDHPDGLRFVSPGHFLFGENGEHGGISEAIVSGDRLEIRRLDGSRPGTTSAVAWRGRAYGVVAQLRFRAPELAAQVPEPFTIYSVPLR